MLIPGKLYACSHVLRANAGITILPNTIMIYLEAEEAVGLVFVKVLLPSGETAEIPFHRGEETVLKPAKQ